MLRLCFVGCFSTGLLPTKPACANLDVVGSEGLSHGHWASRLPLSFAAVAVASVSAIDIPFAPLIFSRARRHKSVSCLRFFVSLRKTLSKFALGRDDNCVEAGEGWIGENGIGEKCGKDYGQ